MDANINYNIITKLLMITNYNYNIIININSLYVVPNIHKHGSLNNYYFPIRNIINYIDYKISTPRNNEHSNYDIYQNIYDMHMYLCECM